MAIQQQNGDIDSGFEESQDSGIINGWSGPQVNQVDLKLVYKHNPDDNDQPHMPDGSTRYLKTTADATCKFLLKN